MLTCIGDREVVGVCRCGREGTLAEIHEHVLLAEQGALVRLRRLDVALLRACEVVFGPRDSWAWWQRANTRGYVFKKGWL